MPRDEGYIRLIHWKQEEISDRLERLAALPHRVEAEVPGTSIRVRELSKDPPVAFVIDLGRLPSHGREVARAVRQSKALRNVPIVFVGGREEKVAAAVEEFPDAAHCSWEEISGAVEEAVANPPPDPIVPQSSSGLGSGRPLAMKLGISRGSVVVLVAAPDGIEGLLGTLPDGARIRRGNRGRRQITIWFTRAEADLDRRIEKVAAAAGEGMLWIAWPKGSSAVETDISEGRVRRAGLEAGIVDSKVCAIDADWSALRFTRRRR